MSYARGVSTKRRFATCVPKRSLGTRRDLWRSLMPVFSAGVFASWHGQLTSQMSWRLSMLEVEPSGGIEEWERSSTRRHYFARGKECIMSDRSASSPCQAPPGYWGEGETTLRLLIVKSRHVQEMVGFYRTLGI